MQILSSLMGEDGGEHYFRICVKASNLELTRNSQVSYRLVSVPQDLARKAAEQRYQDTLKQAGLDEDFVRNKGQGTRTAQGKAQLEVHGCPR